MFTEAGSWRGSFWVLVALAVLSVVLTLTLSLTSESRSPEGRELDIPGQITFAIGLMLVLYAAVEGPESGWTTLPVILSALIGVCFLAGFILVEVGTKSPIFDLTLFRNRVFTVSSVVAVIAVIAVVAVIGMLAFLGACFATSMWLGPVQHQDPLRVAIPFLLLQGPVFVLIPVVSRLLHRVAPTWLLTSGFALMSIGCLLSTRLDVTDLGLTAFVVPHLMIGVGFALCVSSVTAVALDSVPPQLAGMASATTNVLRDLGFALGPIVVGAVALSRAGTAFSSNLRPLRSPGAEPPADSSISSPSLGVRALP